MEDSEGILKEKRQLYIKINVCCLQEEENDGSNLGDKSPKEHKTPRRIIYFANGESMEEYSTEEEDTEENNSEPLLNTGNLSWSSYLRFWALQVVATSVFTCEFLGGKFAALFGLTQSKYQYAIDEYYRTQKKESESDEDGEEIPQMEAAIAPYEKQHLQMKNLKYGSIQCEEISEISQETAGANVDELHKSSLPGL